MGTWRHGITPAQHSNCLKFNFYCVYFWMCLLARVAGHMHGARTIQRCLGLVEHCGVR
jgi:hypothetical protein